MSIPLSAPDIGQREIDYVVQTLRSGRLSLGPRLEEFEEKFAAFVGARYAIAVNSGTSALHLCVRALGIGEADDVLTTSFSFVASSNCILYERATPVFSDICARSLNLDPQEIRRIIARQYFRDPQSARLINRRTGRVLKAILPVHVFGLPVDLASIVEIAREYNLHLIEDACEALGARYAGRHIGTFGDVAAFAFYPNKQITAAEGGMVVTNNPQIAKLCRGLRNQGRDADSAWLRHTELGYNYRLSEVHCALGIAQLERVEELLAARARVAAAYARQLASIPNIQLPETIAEPVDAGYGASSGKEIERSWFAYVIQVHGSPHRHLRDHLISHLRVRGIACQAYFPPIHRQSYFERLGLAAVPLPRTESASTRCVALPLFSAMTDAQVAEVAGAVGEILAAGAATRGITQEPRAKAASASSAAD